MMHVTCVMAFEQQKSYQIVHAVEKTLEEKLLYV